MGMEGYNPTYPPPTTGVEDVGRHSANRRNRRRGQPAPKQSSAYGGETPPQRETTNQTASHKPPNSHNRKNLASKIRSLEKLLKYADSRMTADVRQEKGRELAALVMERERKKANLRAKKNLGKYHKVRFIERQKCSRSLESLRKALAKHQGELRRRAKDAARKNGPDSDMEDEGGVMFPDAVTVEFEEQIRQAEIDLNYTLYAPLGEKYISLFPLTGKEKIAAISNISKSFLETEEEAEVRRLQDDNVVRNATGERPPMWFRVEECTKNGTLEQLRDGKLTTATATLPQVGGKSNLGPKIKSASNWLHDDGAIAAEDLDSEEDSSQDDDKVDGGFFEEI